MSDPENPAQPLLRAPNQPAAVNAGETTENRAYKMAALTLLACVLIVGQAMIAYFLLSQRNDIKSLEEQNNNMKTELTKGRSVSVPVRMHMPMNALTMLTDDYVEEGTDCQLEAAGVKASQPPGFRPACDERGLYKAQQCFMRTCWCVNPVNGEQIPGSVSNGPARCSMAIPYFK
uniref:Thyroglobulin type-1 domain-containing protein n=1 Tax=Seriola lalandi dorsalis TaxID=1841481 RepID=A0A3B4Z4Z5_SERLL